MKLVMNENERETILKIGERIKKGNSFLITCHENPEGDSIGSSLGLFHAIAGLGKKVTLYNSDQVPMNLRFLPGVENWKRELPVHEYYDSIFILDCGEKERVGKENMLVFEKGREIINIDHHYSNKNFGDINLIQPERSSTGEIIYHILEVTGIPIDEKIALCLYVSIVTDTGFFRFSNTTVETMRIVYELMKKGVSHSLVVEQLCERLTHSKIKLLTVFFSSLEYRFEGKVVSISTTEKVFKEYGENPYDLEWYISFIRSINGVEVAIFFVSLDNGLIKVSMRGKGNINLSELAMMFGGGGHQRAAGCLVEGELDEVRESFFTEINRRLGTFC